MTKITQDLTRLLDKLYDLKKEDNFITSVIKSDIKDVENEIEQTKERQSKNEIEKVETESKLSIFMTQRDAFCSIFTGIDNETFQSLNAIGIDLDIQGMIKQIEEKAPEYCDKLNEQISENNNAILDSQQKRDIFNNQLVELNSKLKTSNEDSDKLVDLLNQSLSSDEAERESLTAKYAKEILNNFDVFTADEVSTLAKIILFPEDGLIEYDESYEERSSKGLINLSEYPEDEFEEESNDEEIEEPKLEEEPEEEKNTEETEEEKESVEETEEDIYKDIELTNEETEEEDEEPTELIDLSSLNMDEVESESSDDEEITDIEAGDAIIPIVLMTSEDEEKNETEVEEESEEVVEEPVEEPKELSKIEEVLSNIGLSIEKFEENNEDVEDLYKVLENTEPRFIEENYEILRSLNVEEAAIYECYNNHSYLADTDLNKKVTLLRAKGISEHKIKELIDNDESGFRETYETIDARLSAIESTIDKISDETINSLAVDLTKYADNLNLLNDNGFELDEKDIRNNQAVLYTSNNIRTDIEVLKNYLISIQRKNGKYALGVFFKNSKELLFDVDDVIEANLEELLTTHPEILVNKIDSLIARARYCLEKEESLYEGEDNTSYNKNILDGAKFHKTYNHDADEYVLPNRTTVNETLTDLVPDSSHLVNILNEYYELTKVYKDIKLEDADNELFKKLLKDLEEGLKVQDTSSYTYTVEGIAISKNKVERNLKVLVNDITNKDEIVNNEKAVILIAALYNLRQSEDKLKEIVNNFDASNGGVL